MKWWAIYTQIYKHSHKERNDNLETQAVLTEIVTLCWNLPSGPKHRGWLQKNIAFPKGNRLFAGDFVLIWMKQTPIWFNLQRDGTRNGFSNIKETFAESLKPQISVLHQRMSIFQSSRLVSQVHMMAEKNVKKKYLMSLIPIKILKQHATPNSSLHNLKIYSSKGCKKTSQRWIYVCSYLLS